MKGILVSKGFVAQFGAELQAAVKAAGVTPEIIHLPDDPAQRLPADVIAKIEVAYLTRDIRFSNLYESYGDTVKAAMNLKWANFVSTGIDQHPFLPALHERKHERDAAQRRHDNAGRAAAAHRIWRTWGRRGRGARRRRGGCRARRGRQ
jgi:hypothetical protein